MLKRNQDIRKIKGNIPFWAIAERLEIHENTFYNWMKSEMGSGRKQEVLKVIDEIKNEMKEA